MIARFTSLRVAVPAALFTTLLALLLTAGLARAQEPEPPVVTIPNETCLECHTQEGLHLTLPTGNALSVTVDSDALSGSVHAGLQCQQCHTDIAGYPHGEIAIDSHRDLQVHYSQSCVNCHAEQAEEQVDSVHAQVRAAGVNEAAVCADCHGSHDIQPISRAKHPEISGEVSAETCSQCHDGIFEKYANSVHGDALLNGNPDVPTCIDCHPAHTASDPRTLEFRLESPQLCGDCHADKALMAKYGLSTEVFDTYVSDFHGTTVMLFEKTTPDQATNKAVCTDCHGVHDIQTAHGDQSAMKTNLVKTCQECHPDATTSFADSWLGHYVPTLDNAPLVALVELFYRILIPAVIGFFIIYILIDLQRRIHDRRASKRQSQT
ncbi:MAG: cytochrome C [Caldilineae bacterium]|nr:cytochrome C [Anaerolineae bacterium]MCB0203382.1 cytochrome C [Anaerolineae bacterium]MCB0254513.1 cytochrome C [Anaerolineae bacterium]MCB9153821.1 cytochrome C [Caldilineae bacterium]